MKIFKSRYFAVVSWLVCLVMLTASCSDYSDKEVVGLNERAYEVHYKSLDSTKTYAEKALSLYTPDRKKLSVPSYAVRIRRQIHQNLPVCLPGQLFLPHRQ